jgi:hypothetical protein
MALGNSITLAFALAAVALVGGCQGSGNAVGGSGRVTVAAGNSVAAEGAIVRLKSLEGQWELVSADGKRSDGLIIAASSSGSAVREIMFPGTSHEMTNMYHADGNSVVMTHYCAEGNQPRMRAAVPTEGKPFDFKVDSVTNLRGRGEGYMGSMILTIVDTNTITQEWSHYTLDKGKGPDTATFTFKRLGT